MSGNAHGFSFVRWQRKNVILKIVIFQDFFDCVFNLTQKQIRSFFGSQKTSSCSVRSSTIVAKGGRSRCISKESGTEEKKFWPFLHTVVQKARILAAQYHSEGKEIAYLGCWPTNLCEVQLDRLAEVMIQWWSCLVDKKVKLQKQVQSVVVSVSSTLMYGSVRHNELLKSAPKHCACCPEYEVGLGRYSTYTPCFTDEPFLLSLYTSEKSKQNLNGKSQTNESTPHYFSA